MVWRGYLGFGIAALAGYLLIPAGIGQDVVYVAVGLVAVAAIVFGVWSNQPAQRLPWYLMAVGQLTWVIGDAVSSWNEDIAGNASFPSTADIFYLAAYPLLAVSLGLLVRGRRPRRDFAGLLDSATVTAGIGLLSWVLVAAPTIEASQHSVSGALVGVAYPLGDIVLLGGLVRLVTTPGGRTPAFRWLLAAVGLLVAGDTVSSALSLYTTSNTAAFDLIWLASYVAWGAAALHPSMRSLSEPISSDRVEFTKKRLGALTLAVMVAPGTLCAQQLASVPLAVWPVVVGSVVMFLFVVARMSVAIEQIIAANRQREQLQQKIAYQAAHDSLTDLPNRAQARRLIKSALQRAQRSGTMTALLFVDLDGFKQVNDTFGHRSGDDVLRAVAQRMQDCVRGGDVVARLGGDEFVVLLETVDDESMAIEVAERLVVAAATPITLRDRREARLGASVGIAFGQDGTVDADVLLQEADTAVYRAKMNGRGRTEVFSDALRRELAERADLEAAIGLALANDEFVVHYQPISNVVSGELEGYEALVRWQRPGGGLVPPSDFVPAAEASNLICELDTWVLNNALTQLAEWNLISPKPLTMAVNVSGRHLNRPRIVDDVSSALAAAGVAPRQLVLEITETVLVDDPVAFHHLDRLRALGVTISIDDFGTGYNSISRLQRLPVDVIKIDRSFLDAKPSSAKLLRLLVQAAHTFGLPVVVEGVEYANQLATLKTLNCESAQGFFLGRPMTAAEAYDELAASTDQIAKAS